MNHSKKSQKKGQSRIVFMPIKPVFCNRILSEEKQFEYRRTSVRDNISHVIIYSSFPVKKIVAIAEVTSVIKASPTAIWEKTKRAAGITRKVFRDYFYGSKKACAIEFGKIDKLRWPLHPREISKGFNVPQSFSYVDRDFLDQVIRLGIQDKQVKDRLGFLVFVGGIHGVGKSTLCSTACQEIGCVHLTASELIKIATLESLSVDKKVPDIKGNQEILAKGLSEVRLKEKDYVLDGHFTLLDGAGNIQEIPISTFETIRPDQFVVVTETAKIIAKRLKARDKRSYDEALLKKMQDSEISHAKRIGKALNIPVHFVSSNDSKEFIEILEIS